MTTTQKIIKYASIGFACALIISIISLVLSGGYYILDTLGLFHNDKNITNDNLHEIPSEIPNEVEELYSLDIDLSFTNLDILIGDTFKIETNNSKIIYTNNNGNVKIKDKSKNILNNHKENDLVVYIPEYLNINEVKIDAGAGKIYIEKLNVRDLELDLGAGKTIINNLVASNKVEIEGGASKTELKSCEIRNLDADLGVGEFIYNGILTGKNEIDSGVGAIKINLIDSKDNYMISVDKGIGNISIDGEKLESNRTYGNGDNYIDIDGGVGEIKINFMD